MPEKPIAVDGMPAHLNFPVTPPVSQCVGGYSQEFCCLSNGQILAQLFRHDIFLYTTERWVLNLTKVSPG